MSGWDIQTLFAIPGLEEPSVGEFVAHPDFRQIAAFFLGGVFLCSVNHIAHSGVMQKAFRCISIILSRKKPGQPDPGAVSEKPSIGASHLITDTVLGQDSDLLLFTLALCFAVSSLAYFFSLLAFNPETGGAACAFVVAWGGMAGEAALLVGLLILSFDLRRLGVKQWESVVFWIWLAIGIALVFVTNAVSIGTTKLLGVLGVSLCYRRHFLPTSLTSSLIYFFLELYTVLRLSSRMTPFRHHKHRIATLRNLHIFRGLTLILYTFLMIIPIALPADILAQFIPFSCGAIIILTVYHIPRWPPIQQPLEVAATSLPNDINDCLHPSLPSVPRTQSLLAAPTLRPYFPHASSSDESLGNYSHRPDMPGTRTTYSSRSLDSVTAKSTAGAVGHVAFGRGLKIGPVALSPPPLPVRSRDSTDETSVQREWISRRILFSQVEYAERFETDDRPLCPLVTITHPSGAEMLVRPGTDTARSSIVYGSDILQLNDAADLTKRHSSSRHVYSSPRESQLTSPTHSVAALLVGNDGYAIHRGNDACERSRWGGVEAAGGWEKTRTLMRQATFGPVPANNPLASLHRGASSSSSFSVGQGSRVGEIIVLFRDLFQGH